ncbi:MAG: SDR family oxidoreductase [Alphaproteobacteria bacterium]|nr:SDR family oxidoreductase [Alphaproteobacteria bacterium]
MTKKRLFCFGHGYTCDYLGYELMHAGASRSFPVSWTLAGTTRDPEKKRELSARGIKTYIFDFNTPVPDPLYMLRDVTHILISTPPSDLGDTSYLMHAQDIINLPRLEWVGYLSTTGSYGDRNGGWVDETTEPRPTTKRGSRRFRAEEQWLSLYEQHGIPVHIFRLAGIYGLGRSALDSVRSGIARRIDKSGHAFSRVHVEDIVQVLIASMHKPKPGEIYNVCDDCPVPSHEVIDYACRLVGIDSPPLIPFEDADLVPMTRSFYAENKRVRNNKIKNELGITLKYPDYKSGLHGCLEAETQYIQHGKTKRSAC